MTTIYMTIGSWTGLGNQLFQYATAKTKSIKNNCELVIKPNNQCKLGMFEYFRKQKLTQELPHGLDTVSEKLNTYDEEFDKLEIKKSTIIEGYFQSRKYFDEFKSLVRLMFKFDDDITKESIKWRSQYPSKVICVHIRLPDFKYENPTTFLYSSPTREYIKESIKEFDSNDHLAIFSNHVDWAQQLFGDILTNYKCSYIHGNEQHDMSKMMLCDGYILTPSTFSWWAMYLNEKENLKVVACSPIFNTTAHGAHWNELYNKDFYEKDWKVFNLIENKWTN